MQRHSLNMRMRIAKSMIYRRLLRTLLLPIDLRLESDCVQAMKEYFNEFHEEQIEDHAVWLNGQVKYWDESGKASPELRKLVTTLLAAGNEDQSEAICKNYFAAHDELVKKQLVPSALARSFLSHLLLISRLASEEKMSCAQISQVVDTMNPAAGFSRRSIEAVLKKMSMAPSISLEDISTLYDMDEKLAPDFFKDAVLEECAIAVTAFAFSLGFTKDLGSLLSSLLDEREVDKFTPYVQILHYQCSILEYYDHHSKDFYEFHPRGKAAEFLFDKYPDSMTNAGNPFLNNAKSVGQVNFPWASAKKNNEFPGAAALFLILDGLDEMGYSAKQELAMWVRCFIHRFIVSAEPLDTPLPDSINEDSCTRLIENISIQNTSTKGIIEQRLVDALTVLIHPKDEGWISRGIGDSINASNFSKKKLGDCDFQHIKERQTQAYEAHGGLLTQTYLDEHMRTLPKSAQPRIDEWKTFSNPSDWRINILFVAHEFNAQIPDDFEVDGAKFSVTFLSYNDLVDQTCDLSREKVINQFLLKALSERNTPSSVRRSFLSLVG